jgi:hypothetical protein
MVTMTAPGPFSGHKPTKSPAFTETLLNLAREVDRKMPPKPHRPFVAELIRQVREETGGFWGNQWYQRLVKAAGVGRTPSTRTFNQVLSTLKEGAGEVHGITLKAVNELAKVMLRLEKAVDRMGGQAERMAVAHDDIKRLMTRQVEIADSIQKRQMIFADQSQAYGRMIEEITKTVNGGVAKFMKTAEMMDGVGLEVTIQANRVAMSTERLVEALREGRDGG